MKTKLFPFLITIFFLIIFLLFYKGLKNTSIYTPKANIKSNIPFFEVKLFQDNKVVNSNDIFNNDKVYLMNIWASWCIPCREEHPFLLNLSKENNIEIVGLNYKDNFENAKKFLKELENPYTTILSDKQGVISIEWGAYGVPESFLIYNGKIIKKFTGPLNSNSLSEIKKFIK